MCHVLAVRFKNGFYGSLREAEMENQYFLLFTFFFKTNLCLQS